MRTTPVPQKEGPRANRDIRGVREVQLIDQDGQNRGVMAFFDALALAEEAGLDLVEIAPNAVPPVCKILDYGKHRFSEQKKAAEARKKQKTVDIKEIKLRPGIDDHDYEVKKKAMLRFLGDGDKVKVTLRFRGREIAHQELGMKILSRVKEETVDIAKVESEPTLEGKQMTMVLAPK
ncbi:MAG: translation initiation factor IF-3 [Methylobacteriaceae bacterium]|jgi:translation initiation factor IF-3|nr:translation initiation factor IF-3 [Methylobacteriaceae bacterium]